MKYRLRLAGLGICLMSFCQSMHAQCFGVNPPYQDILDFSQVFVTKTKVHLVIKAEVIYVNSNVSNGTHNFSAEGPMLVNIGDAGYGPCIVATNSDSPEQPFSVTDPIEERISLNMISNTITVKSIINKNATVYSDVTRSGNAIIGNHKGNLIIISLF